ncbi:hypothetical protein [Chondromyces apiculatus]|uniref:Uncharacterized protein n=1 Tax=Chondromyces apiculatus DSM 436 TaxID=1192034 RepID=A0A017T2K1_9BACT|nr:hypothetical protein [Chondromyces apiculatus]EYF02786.1 Hypothetical protein CAP_6521 [Chondromyces apiculatus DSM 436]
MARSEERRSHPGDVMFAALSEPRISLDPEVRDALQRIRGYRRTPLLYLRWAAVHPYSVALLCAVGLAALVSWSFPVLLAGLSLSWVLLGISPWVRCLRAALDERLDVHEQATVEQARDALVQQMGAPHQVEFARLERIMERTRENVARRLDVAPELAAMPDGSRLGASYIQLAIALRAGRESLASTSYHELMETIGALETVRVASTDRMRALAERRLEVAYRRVSCWCRTRDGMEAIEQQLATVVELIQLLHEQSLAPEQLQLDGVEVGRFLRELDDSEGALREIAALAMEEARNGARLRGPVRVGEVGGVGEVGDLDRALAEVIAAEEMLDAELLEGQGEARASLPCQVPHVAAG